MILIFLTTLQSGHNYFLFTVIETEAPPASITCLSKEEVNSNRFCGFCWSSGLLVALQESIRLNS